MMKKKQSKEYVKIHQIYRYLEFVSYLGSREHDMTRATQNIQFKSYNDVVHK